MKGTAQRIVPPIWAAGCKWRGRAALRHVPWYSPRIGRRNAAEVRKDVRPEGDAVGVEAVSGRVGGMFGDELEIAVKLHHSARRMAAGAAHHRYQKTTLGQSVELVGDGRQRRIGGAEEFWFSRIGTIKKQDPLLPPADAPHPPPCHPPP